MTPTTTDATTERVEGERVDRPLTSDEKLFLKHGIDVAMCYFRYLKRNKPAYFQEEEQKALDGLERAWDIAASIKDATVKID